MFKNDRMMTIFTGLILAVFAGSMVQYGDRFMALLSGESQFQTSDDFYSVRAGSSQFLDVLANDDQTGPILVMSQPQCGRVALSGANQLQYSSDSSCSGEVVFTYCVDTSDGCTKNSVTLNVITLANTQVAAADQQTSAEAVRVEGFDQDGDDLEGQSEESAEAETAPVIVASIAPATQVEQAPTLNNIIISMQPPTLVAPTIDEFVTPSVATASIRQQNIILENTAENSDTGINTQSSTATVAPIEFGVANFGADLGGENSNVLIGAPAPDTQQVATTISPQLAEIAPNANPVSAQLERGPVALAALPDTGETSFGTFTENSEAGAQLAASPNTDTFISPINDQTVAFAQIEPDQNALQIERSGTTALIALQLTGPPLVDSSRDQLVPQLPNLANDQNVTLVAPDPIALANAVQDNLSDIVPKQGPNTFIFANSQGNADALLQASLGDSDVLLSAPLTLSVTWRSAALPATLAGDPAANGHLTASVSQLQINSGSLQITAPADINARPAVVMASLSIGQTEFGQELLFSSLAAPFSISGALPRINKNVPSIFPNIQNVIEPTTELASLDTNNVDQQNTTAAIPQLSTCEIFLDPSVRDGANILLFLSAECKPNMPVTISHAGLEFTILTEADGSANVIIPALQRTAEIRATFADGSTESTVALVTQITEVSRSAVTWRGNADLDLHAFEYGATPGSDGHIWADSARDFRSARLRGGGYLVELGDPSIEGGAKAEVYTMPLGRTVERGSVSMTLEVSNTDEVCGQSISARTLRTRSENSAGSRSIRFTAPGCNGSRVTNLRVPGAVDDIRLVASN